MTANASSRPEVPADAGTSPRPSTNTRTGALFFKIVGPHLHRAVLGKRVFLCERKATRSETGLSVRWTAFEGEMPLGTDCPTLNDAKNLCRLAACAAEQVSSAPAPAKSATKR